MTKTITFACMAFYFHEKLWNRLERRRHVRRARLPIPLSV